MNSLLDAFFRTLDVVDVARERLDRALGRSPRPEPWTTEWSPVPDAPRPNRGAPPLNVPAPSTAPSRPRAPKKKRAAEPVAMTKPVTKKSGGNRKGSVDRSGKDFDSPRAKAIVERLRTEGAGVITADAALEGKRVLARVLWALGAADRAGSELGLTAADASALLHLAAGVEVFSTNVARTCRDEIDLIIESVPDGRSKRYKLTEAGRAAAAELDVRPI